MIMVQIFRTNYNFSKFTYKKFYTSKPVFNSISESKNWNDNSFTDIRISFDNNNRIDKDIIIINNTYRYVYNFDQLQNDTNFYNNFNSRFSLNLDKINIKL